MWFSTAAASMIGGFGGAALGIFGGVWGSIAGFSASKGKRRGLVLNTAKGMIILGVGLLAAGAVAFSPASPAMSGTFFLRWGCGPP